MVPRGPCTLHVLRDCWVHGVVDENTLVWGQGLCDWLPIRNVRTLVPQIRTVEGRQHVLILTEPALCRPCPNLTLSLSEGDLTLQN